MQGATYCGVSICGVQSLVSLPPLLQKGLEELLLALSTLHLADLLQQASQVLGQHRHVHVAIDLRGAPFTNCLEGDVNGGRKILASLLLIAWGWEEGEGGKKEATAYS